MSIWSRLKELEGVVECENKVICDHAKIFMPRAELLTCDSCGCAVVKGQEVKGAVEIRRRSPQKDPENLTQVGIWQWHMVGYFPGHPTEPYLHTPVYCKRCAGEKAKPKRSHHKK